jgi:hypothetical protein
MADEKKLNGFFLYKNDVWAEVKQQMPGCNAQLIAERVGELWNQLPEDEKARYKQMARDGVRNSNPLTKGWSEPCQFIPPPPIPSLQVAPRPKDAYAHFTSEKRPIIAATDPQALESDISRAIADLWRRMTEAERKPYFDRAKKAQNHPENGLSLDPEAYLQTLRDARRPFYRIGRKSGSTV